MVEHDTFNLDELHDALVQRIRARHDSSTVGILRRSHRDLRDCFNGNPDAVDVANLLPRMDGVTRSKLLALYPKG